MRELEAEVIVVVSAQGEQIARHALADGATRRVIDPAHFAAVATRPSQTRPGARASGPLVRVAAPPGAAALVLDAPLVEVRPLADYDRLAEVRP